ncbi:tyrosine-type recombinase/integrase [Sutcliffiella sp. NC1]|uniref:tyrosine-type recombinase/integrase n=1 Tax=Sutcliffiella sp. NC1 TaxID=3004096 RepID=UPI0022DDEBAD|nr:tyrosine-type recombinase/integrase [Sutcliffiella sp. NC1]WBL16036.1 tyrosine-type recombinase/integrase [Sutcliffiella sp. NC1]
MKYVEAIKKIEDIQAIKQFLKNQSLRDYLLFVMGINTGLRISELLCLRWEDVLDNDGDVKEFLQLPNLPPIYLNQQVQISISEYLNNELPNQDHFIFQSKKLSGPISRQQAYRIINSAAKEVGIPDKIGTHTLRKTYGYHAFNKGIAISLLQKIFNHTSSSETLRYLGITKCKDSPVKIDVNL